MRVLKTATTEKGEKGEHAEPVHVEQAQCATDRAAAVVRVRADLYHVLCGPYPSVQVLGALLWLNCTAC